MDELYDAKPCDESAHELPVSRSPRAWAVTTMAANLLGPEYKTDVTKRRLDSVVSA